MPHTPAPPIDPTTLKVPLTPAQRTAILQYVETWAMPSDPDKQGFALAAITGNNSFVPGADITAYNVGKYDAQAISVYKSFASGTAIVPPGYQGDVKTTIHIPNPFHSIGDFINALFSANLWLRVAEVGLGVVLVAVALAHVSDNAAKIVKATPIGRLT